MGDRKVEEVYDTKSDMILYDIDRDEVRNIATDTTLQETFRHGIPTASAFTIRLPPIPKV